MNDNDNIDTDSVDYKHLLKECMKDWMNCEGGCWNADYEDGLTQKEKNAVNAISKELEQLEQ